MYKKKHSPAQVVYKPSEQAIVDSERSNDRKFSFLSSETKPDYRPLAERGLKMIYYNYSPSFLELSFIMLALPGRNLTQPSLDHRPYGAERYQQADFRGGTKKTSADSADLSALSLDKRNLSLASEKDLKTCVNMDTKFQQVVQQQTAARSLNLIYYLLLLFFRCRRNGAEEA